MHGDSSGTFNRKSSWEPTISFSQLEVGDKGQVDIKHSQRSNIRTLSDKNTYPSQIQLGLITIDPTGNKRIIKQGCSFRNSATPRWVLLKSVPSTEKGWGAETCDKFESAKPVCSNITLQDGRNPYLERTGKARRLACKSRLERRIFYIPYSSDHRKYLRFVFQEKNVRFQLPSLWSLISSVGLYQDPETCISPPMRDRSMYGCLHRRHISAGGVCTVNRRPSTRTIVYLLECLEFMINKQS